MTDQILLREIQRLPDDLKAEVLNFIGYLLSKQKTRPQPQSVKLEHSAEEIEAAIRIVQQGCDMSSFGDALEYQIDIRQDRELPFRD
jgi:hypothetical protein